MGNLDYEFTIKGGILVLKRLTSTFSKYKLLICAVFLISLLLFLILLSSALLLLSLRLFLCLEDISIV
ncbi:MAG: hypothetical protein ACFFDI_27560, partial [Promethearchaeota archaeon]